MTIEYRGEKFRRLQQTQAHPIPPQKVARSPRKGRATVKLIRFGQQGVAGSPARTGESASDKARRASFKARHAKNIAKGKMSAAFWANREKW
jgi:hypothetical protein